MRIDHPCIAMKNIDVQAPERTRLGTRRADDADLRPLGWWARGKPDT